jgi:hypothetical protein
MLEVANSEHALFGVLSQSYSFRCFTVDNDSTFGLFNISSRKYIPVFKTKAPQTRLSHEALVEQPPPWKAVFLSFGFSNCLSSYGPCLFAPTQSGSKNIDACTSEMAARVKIFFLNLKRT